ncbi:MAG: NTP transferase domain-containing protein, partial [Bryobacteraceae bacterium]|nr:NTP transferase domain-containing protein [Bryobacteraceae bacterium]
REATFVINTDPERGQLTSLQCGLQEVYSSEPMADYVFFTPVDYPSIRESSVTSVREHAGPYPVVPEYNGRHGHPVLIPTTLIPEFLALNETETARVVMHRHAGRTRYVDVDDPGILLDVDDPEAYRAITQGIL